MINFSNSKGIAFPDTFAIIVQKILGNDYLLEWDGWEECFPDLYYDPHDGLTALQNDSIRALVARPPQPISNGVLRLNTEQEAGGEVVYTVDTGGVAILLLNVRKMLRLQVSVDPEYEMPGKSKHQPGYQEAGKEDTEKVAPSQIHQCRPAIFEKQKVPLVDTNIDHSEVTILLHESSYFLFPVSEFIATCNGSCGTKFF